MRKTDLIFSAVFILCFVVAASQLFKLEDMNSAVVSAKLFPWLVVGLGLVVGVLETIRTLLSASDDKRRSLRAISAVAFAPRRMMLLALFVAYLFAIQPIGFLLATAIFCVATIVLLAPRRSFGTVAVACAIAVGTSSFIYVLLVVYLQAFLP
ncbi:tripartite tricarboxylate transporter TctB family protein [Consotaella salsifontis]|uniref:Tripartite tricarboxylate transporter TctB family protein n=1 Tax=Consotaella salsifontis TaxID=1365950 RepID=A0A1T4TCF7_9HYPH|nr:tripartite tricarboxylate transporter TctB family protein [Consotaella salsifontis]SKA38021.1 Tripartite tricarboxylate transporter TctB family protein [Consotaella salsifontis]